VSLDFSITIDIDAPPETVWAVMSDVERWHEWTPSVRGIRRFDTGPLRVGSRALVRQPRLPPAMWKVTAVDPGRSFSWTSGMPLMRVDAHHGVSPVEGRSRATLSIHYKGVLGRLLGRALRRVNEEYLALEAQGLKRRSEERAAAAASAPSQPGSNR
jgi:hypothetical protein